MRTSTLLSLLLFNSLWGDEPRRVGVTDPLPFRAVPIDYPSDELDDAVVTLKRRLVDGEVVLTHHESSGYLRDLLKHLDIPVESQALVFSRTSVHKRWISPKTPRAIYFNDEVSVGWVPGAPVLEIAAHDPVKGAIFYTLAQTPAGRLDADGVARFQREERCLTCHVSTSTLNVPGHLLRSFMVDDRGEPQNGYSPVTQATRFPQRWGGWYVTGRADQLIHMGNLVGPKDAARHEEEPVFRGTVGDLKSLVDLSRYPTDSSDLVALLVLQHQLQFYNLVTRVQFEYQLDCQSDAEERLARYALMEDEASLPGPVAGSTDYAVRYQALGSKGHAALRELDLETRLYRNRLSPLVKSRSFESLPAEVKTRLWKRFRDARGDLIDEG